MAFLNGVIGVSRKKVGEIVAFRNGGKTIARKYLGTGEIANPRTAGQLAQRERFGLLAETLSMAAAFFNHSFGAYRRYFNGFSAAMHYNWADLITGSYPLYTVDPTKLIISRGGLLGLDGVQVTANANHGVTLTWTDNTGQGNARNDDKVSFVLWIPTFGSLTKMFAFENVADRSTGTYAQSWLLQAPGETAHVYVCIHRNGGSKYSTSQYLGTVTLQ